VPQLEAVDRGAKATGERAYAYLTVTVVPVDHWLSGGAIVQHTGALALELVLSSISSFCAIFIIIEGRFEGLARNSCTASCDELVDGATSAMRDGIDWSSAVAVDAEHGGVDSPSAAFAARCRPKSCRTEAFCIGLDVAKKMHPIC